MTRCSSCSIGRWRRSFPTATTTSSGSNSSRTSRASSTTPIAAASRSRPSSPRPSPTRAGSKRRPRRLAPCARSRSGSSSGCVSSRPASTACSAPTTRGATTRWWPRFGPSSRSRSRRSVCAWSADRGPTVAAELAAAHRERDEAAARAAELRARLSGLGYTEPAFRDGPRSRDGRRPGARRRRARPGPCARRRVGCRGGRRGGGAAPDGAG